MGRSNATAGDAGDGELLQACVPGRQLEALPYQSASKQAPANGHGLILSEPQEAQETGWMDMAINVSDAYRATLSSADLTKFDAMCEAHGRRPPTAAMASFDEPSCIAHAKSVRGACSWR